MHADILGEHLIEPRSHTRTAVGDRRPRAHLRRHRQTTADQVDGQSPARAKLLTEELPQRSVRGRRVREAEGVGLADERTATVEGVERRARRPEEEDDEHLVDIATDMVERCGYRGSQGGLRSSHGGLDLNLRARRDAHQPITGQ